MNDLQRLLDAQSRRSASVVTAAVVRRNPDGTYRVRNVATGSERDVEKASASDEFTPGEFVTVGSPSNSRAVLGARDVILSRSRQHRGTSLTVPETQATTITAPAIFSTDPDPIELEAGGAAVGATIYGLGFTGLTTDYEDAGITDDSAPVVTATEITLSLVAAADVASGEYDLTIGSAVRRGAIHVWAAPPVEYERYWLADFATGLDAGGAGTGRVRVFRWLDPEHSASELDIDYDGTAVPEMGVEVGGVLTEGPYDSTTAPAGWTIPADCTITNGLGTFAFDVPMPGPPGANILVRATGALVTSAWHGMPYTS